MTVLDYYEVLGVSPQATSEEIKRAYRRLAREHHPDRNPDDPEAERRFREIAAAYEVLNDSQKRSNYDRFGTADAVADPFDIFSTLFGGGFGFETDQRAASNVGEDIEVLLELDFADAVFGSEQEIRVNLPVPCDECGATGSEPGTEAESCDDCSGTGRVRQLTQSILGQMMSTGPCRRCRGTGRLIRNPCRACRGRGRLRGERIYPIEVPPGVDNGTILRLSGKGGVGGMGGPYGDLYVRIKVRPHSIFQRSKDDLIARIEVSFTQAALGGMLQLDTLEGSEEIRIKPGTQSGEVVVCRRKGVPSQRGSGRGDLIVEIRVTTPTDLDDRQSELLHELALLRGEQVDSGRRLKRLRSSFKS